MHFGVSMGRRESGEGVLVSVASDLPRRFPDDQLSKDRTCCSVRCICTLHLERATLAQETSSLDRDFLAFV